MMSWYVVHTKAGKERLAEQSLKDAGYEVFFPYYLAEVNHARQQYNVTRPYFPRYMFISVGEDQGFHAANTAMGVATILYSLVSGNEYGPLAVPIETINEMRERCDKFGLVSDVAPDTAVTRFTPIFSKGTPVNVTDGLLKGAEGVIYFDDGEDESVTIEVLLMGKKVVVPIRADCLAKRRIHRENVLTAAYV